MKNIVKLLTGIAILILLSCNKNNDNVHLQNHDSDQMMDSMHVMMSKMDTMHITNDPDVDFTSMMIMHHKGAISMSNLELQEGKSDSLKKMARLIIDEQQQEVQEFTSVLSSLQVDNSDPAFSMEQKQNMVKMGQVADVQLITGDIDNDFATLMIVHHQAAIDNASAYLHHGNNANLKNKANSIIDTQSQQIDDLSSWLKTNKR